MVENEIVENGVTRKRPSVRELEVLRAILKLQKTTAAAVELGITQPAVSKALASLEERIGKQLFIRKNGHLEPTPAAIGLDREAASILEALERLSGNVGLPDSNRLEIATTSTLAHHYLSRALPAFRREYSAANLQVEIFNHSDVIHAVADGRVDIGLLDETQARFNVKAEVLRSNRANVVLPANHRLVSAPRLSVQDIADEPMIALLPRFAVRAQIDRIFEEAGVAPLIVMESSTAAFAVSMVESGIGLTIVNPFPFNLTPLDGIVFKEFEPALRIETSILTSRYHRKSALADTFIHYLKQF